MSRLSTSRRRQASRASPYVRPPAIVGKPIREDDDTLIGRMAQALRDSFAEKDEATAADLVRAGFLEPDVERLGDQAVALAKRQFVRRV